MSLWLWEFSVYKNYFVRHFLLVSFGTLWCFYRRRSLLLEDKHWAYLHLKLHQQKLSLHFTLLYCIPIWLTSCLLERECVWNGLCWHLLLNAQVYYLHFNWKCWCRGKIELQKNLEYDDWSHLLSVSSQ